MIRLPYTRQLYQSSQGQWVLVSERPALIQESVDGRTEREMRRQAKATGRWLREVWWYKDPYGDGSWSRDFAITYAPDGSYGRHST